MTFISVHITPDKSIGNSDFIQYKSILSVKYGEKYKIFDIFAGKL